ncbi:hypothetical protein HMPREF0868_0712 [Mageeibacillus indolicus UPII9-5]|uniref:Uncharacterized protein n=1 Tax=Mageeibacillus indolicus (strain UPII9-5) TaxID=699246 RepID=D3R1H5_MAGIU|nr:hypothetical protein HMPREF0868_0712 [Mageeibacillus indolicus UPII9-5]
MREYSALMWLLLAVVVTVFDSPCLALAFSFVSRFGRLGSGLAWGEDIGDKFLSGIDYLL